MAEYGSVDTTQSTSHSKLVSDWINSDASVGRKRRRRPTTRDFVLVGLVAAANFTEKIIYYGIVTNLVLYCTNYLDYSSADATVFSLVYTGTNYVLTFFGGWLSDSWLGNYNTIFLGLLICLVATTTLPMLAYDWSAAYGVAYGMDVWTARAFFIVTLTIANLGMAPVKACCSPFSGLQMEEYGNDVIQSVYHWVYLISEIAPLFAYGVLSYIEEDISFFTGYLIVLGFNIAIIFIFCAGRDYYKNRKPQGKKKLYEICLMLATAIEMRTSSTCCWFNGCCHTSEEKKHLTTINEGAWVVEDTDNNQIALATIGDGLGASNGGEMNIVVEQDIPESCFDRLKKEYGGPFHAQKVEELKWLLDTLVILSVAILYNTIRFQYSTTYVLQAECLNLGTTPVSLLALFVPLFVIITVPLVQRVVYPLLESKGVQVTLIKRMGFGLVCGFFSLVCAIVVEYCRKHDMANGGVIEQEISGAFFTASTLSIYVQIPQYIFIGVGDVFVLITGLEFAFSQSPKSLQAFITGAYLLYNGLGSLFGSLLVTIVNAASAGHEWIPDNINEGHLEYYFMLLAGFDFLNMAFLYLVTRNYRYVTQYDLKH